MLQKKSEATMLHKMKLRHSRENSNFYSHLVIERQALQARRIEIIMDVVREVDANFLNRKTEAWCPLLSDGFHILRRESMIA